MRNNTVFVLCDFHNISMVCSLMISWL